MNGAFWHDWEVEVLAQWESIVYSSCRPPIDGSDTVGLLSPNFCTIDPTTDGVLTRLQGALFPVDIRRVCISDLFHFLGCLSAASLLRHILSRCVLDLRFLGSSHF